jgi:protein gp37
MGQRKYANGFAYTEHQDAVGLPRSWRASKRIFVNSMSDLFHEDASKEFVFRVLGVMLDVPRHTYQVLTKRPGKAAAWINEFCRINDLEQLPKHIWVGTSVEDASVVFRLDQLRRVPVHVRFLSCEPLIGSLGDLDLAGIHWVIVGGESGRDFRPISAEWVRELRDHCARCAVPFFFKQWGGLTPKAKGRELDGRTWNDFPDGSLTVQRAMPSERSEPQHHRQMSLLGASAFQG